MYVLMEGNKVADIFIDPDPNFPNIPIEQRLPSAVLSRCLVVADTIQVQNGWVLTADGFAPADYTPAPITLQDYRKTALRSLDGYCSGAIYAGTTVACSAERGSKHYSFPDEAQRAITLMAQGVPLGQTTFSYKADNEDYNPYTVDEIKVLFKALGDWVTANTKYKEILEKWIAQEADTTVLQGLHYWSTPPKELLDELLAYLAQLGIDAAGLVGLLK